MDSIGIELRGRMDGRMEGFCHACDELDLEGVVV